ncbi:hypothetical protein [Agaribacterium sp. ZY112]|uniref:hypothetical protein n=1 Tax=Agaribacterium sp. ZY112 TaxID=3233574 RepID=UPI0035257062
MRKKVLTGLTLAAILTSIDASAGDNTSGESSSKHLFQAGTGFGQLSNDYYDSSYSLSASYTYEYGKLQYSFGGIRQGSMTTSNDIEAEVDALYFSVGKEFKTKPLNYALRLGANYNESEVFYQKHKLGSDSDIGMIAIAEVIKPFGPVFALVGNIKYLNQISGESLGIVSIDARLAF